MLLVVVAFCIVLPLDFDLIELLRVRDIIRDDLVVKVGLEIGFGRVGRRSLHALALAPRGLGSLWSGLALGGSRRLLASGSGGRGEPIGTGVLGDLLDLGETLFDGARGGTGIVAAG